MKQKSLLVLLVILAISLESCSLFRSKSEQDTASNPTPTSTQATQPTATNTAKANQVVGIGGLIPATNPDVRVSGSVRGRQDPFAIIAIRPEITTKETEQNTKVTTTSTSTSQPSKSDGSSSSSSNTKKSTPAITALKTRPVASLAEDVIVSGLVKLEGTTKLIVKEPGEALSRYVSVGQYISNGKILVKQILSENRSTPEVILEENGIEITKKIGEKPTDNSTLPAPQAINPTLEQLPQNFVSWVANYSSPEK